MNLVESIKYVSEKFVYKSDKKFIIDSWRVMQEDNGKFYGDCEDFSLTVFWYLSGCNIFKFLFNLMILHCYSLIWCKTYTGELHFVGKYGDMYFDNWTHEALPEKEFFEKTGHKKIMKMFMPICILQLIRGLFSK
jgi:hypothetical protein